MKASRKALLLGLCMAASVVTMPAVVSAGVILDIDVAPPPVRVETVPVLEPGYVWRRVIGNGRADSMCGFPADAFMSAAATIGCPTIGDQRGPHWHHERGHWER